MLKQEKKEGKGDAPGSDDEEGDDDDPVLRGEICRAVFKDAAEKSWPEEEGGVPAVLCSLLKMAAGFPACAKPKDGHFGVPDMAGHLRESFPQSPLVWDSLANLAVSNSGLRKCVEIYHEGLERLEGEDRKRLRRLQVDALLRAAGEEGKKGLPAGDRRLAAEEVRLAVEEEGEASAVMTEEQYKAWVTLMGDAAGARRKHPWREEEGK